MNPIVCRDCQFAVPATQFTDGNKWLFARCGRTALPDYSGSGLLKFKSYCDLERKYGDCGVRAKNFLPRNAESGHVYVLTPEPQKRSGWCEVFAPLAFAFSVLAAVLIAALIHRVSA